MRREIGMYAVLFCVFGLVNFMVLVNAQEAPKSSANAEITPVKAPEPAAPKPDAKDVALPPPVSDAVRAKVELVKEDQKRQRDILARLQEAFNNTQAIIANDGRQLDDLGAAAVKDAKLDADKWRLDADKMEFARKPEVKKPDEKAGPGASKPDTGGQR